MRKRNYCDEIFDKIYVQLKKKCQTDLQKNKPFKFVELKI